jgi:hypothetical protein
MRLEKLGPVGLNFLECGSKAPAFPAEATSITARARQNPLGAYSISASINCFLCFDGRFRLSGITRVTAGAIPEFRAARRASVPLSNTFLRFRIIRTPAQRISSKKENN